VKTYIGVKQVMAEEDERDGQPGYKVVYPDGYESWSPKEVFDRAYLEMPENMTSEPNYEMINNFISVATVVDREDNTILATLILRSGFEQQALGGYDPIDGMTDDEKADYILIKSKEIIWDYLKFVHQWAVKGLSPVYGQLEPMTKKDFDLLLAPVPIGKPS